MKIKKIGISIVGVAGVVGAIVIGNKNPKTTTEVIKKAAKTVKGKEDYFGGIPLSEFNMIAKQCYHGIKCTVDQWGFLVFHHKSNRGHQTIRVQMKMNDSGELVNLGGYYPGQWKSTADDFVELVNNSLNLKK